MSSAIISPKEIVRYLDKVIDEVTDGPEEKAEFLIDLNNALHTICEKN